MNDNKDKLILGIITFAWFMTFVLSCLLVGVLGWAIIEVVTWLVHHH